MCLLFASTLAQPQDDTVENRIATCVAIEGALERLESYEQLARNFGLVVSTETVTSGQRQLDFPSDDN